MGYIKEVLKKNNVTMVIHVAIGIFISFITSYKADYFQGIIDGLTVGTLALGSILFYGLIVFASYLISYLITYQISCLIEKNK